MVAATATAYGAAELKRTAQRSMTWALGLAGAAHLIAVAAWWIASHRTEEPPTRTVRVVNYSELVLPPSLSSANAPAAIAVELPKQIAKPKFATPVPVPDEVAKPEETIPTQE